MSDRRVAELAEQCLHLSGESAKWKIAHARVLRIASDYAAKIDELLATVAGLNESLLTATAELEQKKAKVDQLELQIARMETEQACPARRK